MRKERKIKNAKMIVVATIVLLAAPLLSCQKYGPVVKILDQANTDTARMWKNRILANGIDSAYDNENKTILWAAIDGYNVNLTKAILECGVNPNTSVYNNYTALMYVFAQRSQVSESEKSAKNAIIDLLLEHKAWAQVENSNGDIIFDAYMFALSMRDESIIDILFKYNKNPPLDYSNVTPMMDRSLQDVTSFGNLFRELYTGPTYKEDLAHRSDILERYINAGYKPNRRDFYSLMMYMFYRDNIRADLYESFIGKFVDSGLYDCFRDEEDGRYDLNYVQLQDSVFFHYISDYDGPRMLKWYPVLSEHNIFLGPTSENQYLVSVLLSGQDFNDTWDESTRGQYAAIVTESDIVAGHRWQY
jgi:hypothetical protein